MENFTPDGKTHGLTSRFLFGSRNGEITVAVKPSDLDLDMKDFQFAKMTPQTDNESGIPIPVCRLRS